MIKEVNPHINTGLFLGLNPQKSYSIFLLPKLITNLRTSKLSISNSFFKSASAEELFGNLPDDLNGKIATLHQRITQSPTLRSSLNEIATTTEDLVGDPVTFNKHFDGLLSAVNIDRKHKPEYLPDGESAWSEVGNAIFQMVNSIIHGTVASESNQNNVEQLIKKFENYNSKLASVPDFVKKYLFGSSKSLFFNTFFKMSNLVNKTIRTPEGKFTSETSRQHTNFSDFERPGNEKYTPAYERGQRLDPIQSSFGFSLDEVKKFVFNWQRLNRKEKLDSILEAIYASDDIPDSIKSQINAQVLSNAMERVTGGIDRTSKLLADIAATKDASVAQRATTKIQEILSQDFIFRETVNINSQDTPEQELQESEEAVDYRTQNRNMINDIINKNYPVFKQQSAIYHDPFNLRSTLNSKEMDAVLKNPKLFFESTHYKNAIMSYLIGLALLNVDYAYNYSETGKKGGRKSGGDAFDQNVANEITSEANSLFSDKLQDRHIAQIVSSSIKEYNNAPSDQRRRYRNFINILHRDLATSHAVYSSGLQWGKLTPGDIDTVSKKVMDSLYPILAESARRRQFKVVNDKNAIEKTRSTMVATNLDDEMILSLIKKEVTNKNNAVQEMLRQRETSQNGAQVDLNQIISDMKIKFSDLSARNSDALALTRPEITVSSGVFRGIISNNPIRLSESNEQNVFLKWLVRNQKL